MRVVVLGAGYAGLTVIRRLERLLPDSVELILVDESDEHLLLHELHRVVRRPKVAETITLPLSDIVSRAEIRQDRVTEVDTEKRVVTFEDAEPLEYDVGAVCLGSETAFHGLPGVEEHAIPLKRLDHAREIREAALDAPEGEVVVGGAGLSGIQVAGELAALSREEVLALDVTLVEVEQRIAPRLGPTVADAIRRELDSQGIRVETDVAVESADETAVKLDDGRELLADVFVWTGGIRGPSALNGERQSVDAELEIADGTFLVGDAGEVLDADGQTVPASAQTAVQQGRVAATNVAERVERESGDGLTIPELYRYDEPGWAVSVGDAAVAQIGPVVVNGEAARAAKAAIGAGHLGSVGAVSRATSLIASELGWPGPDCSGTTRTLDTVLASLPTDPASPGQFGYPFANLAFGLTSSFTGDEPIDLTR